MLLIFASEILVVILVLGTSLWGAYVHIWVLSLWDLFLAKDKLKQALIYISIFGFLLAMFWLCYLRVVFTNPGRVPFQKEPFVSMTKVTFGISIALDLRNIDD